MSLEEPHPNFGSYAFVGIQTWACIVFQTIVRSSASDDYFLPTPDFSAFQMLARRGKVLCRLLDAGTM